jgi:acyl-CoA thioester hydrolase
MEETSPDALLTHRGTVYPWHCDHVGHMNVMWYVGKFDEATWQFFNTLGLSASFLQTAKRGMAAVDQHITYLKELRAGSVVTVRTTLLEIKEKRIRFEHVMTDDERNVIAARTTLIAVCIDSESRRACALPEFVAVNAATRLPANLAK